MAATVRRTQAARAMEGTPVPLPANEAGRVRDPVATQGRILAAAKAEFARKGLAGGRVDSIAARAKINKRMIYHYFSSKDRLFLAVLEAAYEDIRGKERALKLETLEPVAAIEKLVSFTWNYFVKNPEFLRLLNSANLHRGVHLKQSKRVKAMHVPFMEMIRAVLERGEAAGLFRPGLDAVQLYISITALAYYYLTNRYTTSIIYDTDLNTPEALARRHAVIQDTILHYVLKDPAKVI